MNTLSHAKDIEYSLTSGKCTPYFQPLNKISSIASSPVVTGFSLEHSYFHIEVYYYNSVARAVNQNNIIRHEMDTPFVSLVGSSLYRKVLYLFAYKVKSIPSANFNITVWRSHRCQSFFFFFF